jgi:hypothetical protein
MAVDQFPCELGVVVVVWDVSWKSTLNITGKAGEFRLQQVPTKGSSRQPTGSKGADPRAEALAWCQVCSSSAHLNNRRNWYSMFFAQGCCLKVFCSLRWLVSEIQRQYI